MNASTLFGFGAAPNPPQQILCAVVDAYMTARGMDAQTLTEGVLTDREMLAFVSFVDGAITALESQANTTQTEAAQ